ncbi:unnamed protein product [Cuscuta epithymum]|uniref:Major facilitator superfamily (MFS) profile domain-containing protein n=1 Tax=Cuscuta epithymum TaxID=186058 RepID=A0AAV0DIP4_9ASTE|nr:unnamed protein product [Cuscuta epithymum]CAH9126818.1 unnamed protein product [Cuscuta epithymum]
MLITGFGIQCFQQITGIDAMVYYSPEILKAAGITGESKLLARLAATVAVGITKTAFILIAIFLIDRVGRKPLLYVSTIGMTICLFGLGFALTFLSSQGSLGIPASILFVCGNVAFFSIGLGPVCWVLTSEIFPLKYRAQASALGGVGNRVCSGVVAMSFLSVSRVITVGGTFFVFSAISASVVAFTYILPPFPKILPTFFFGPFPKILLTFPFWTICVAHIHFTFFSYNHNHTFPLYSTFLIGVPSQTGKNF